MQFLQYIELDGNCYYDTGLLFEGSHTRVEMTFTPMSGYSGEYYFGAMPSGWNKSTQAKRARIALGRGGNDITYYPMFGDPSAGRYGTLESGVTTFLILDDTGFYQDRTLITGWTPTVYLNTNETMYIGACNCPDFSAATTGYTAYRAGWGHYGEVKIYSVLGGDLFLEGDFIPAEDLVYGVGFYDAVNNRFLENIGAGIPVAGPAISGPLFGESAVTRMLINSEDVKEIYLGDKPIYYNPASLI